jgi:S-adenosyl methyltransferase
MTTTWVETMGLVESPLLSNGHGGFGKRLGETSWSKDQYRAPSRLRGGKDNFTADREAAEAILAVVPEGRRVAQENRAFLRRVVRYLTAEAGIRQFIDLGTGLPTQGNVHEIAQEVAPGTRVERLFGGLDLIAPGLVPAPDGTPTSARAPAAAKEPRGCSPERARSPDRLMPNPPRHAFVGCR